MSSRATRSKFATDLMFRLWDETRSQWVTHNSRSIWTTVGPVNTLRDRMVAEGRNPDTLTVERVTVKVL